MTFGPTCHAVDRKLGLHQLTKNHKPLAKVGGDSEDSQLLHLCWVRFCAYLKTTPNKVHTSHCSTFMQQDEIHPDGFQRHISPLLYQVLQLFVKYHAPAALTRKDGSTRLRAFDIESATFSLKKTRGSFLDDGCYVTLRGPTHPGQANVGPRCNHSFTMQCLKLGCWGWRPGCFTCQARDALVEIQVWKHWKERCWLDGAIYVFFPTIQKVANGSFMQIKSCKAVFVRAWNLPNCALSTMYHFLIQAGIVPSWPSQVYISIWRSTRLRWVEYGEIIHFRSKLPTFLQVWI